MAAPTRLTRRRLLAWAAGAAALAVARPWGTQASAAASYLGAVARPDGGYGAALLDAGGAIRWETPLPQRGHGLAHRPRQRELVVFARRPGAFFLALHADSGRVIRAVASAPGRHFQGHGMFSPDGRWLFATEHALDAGHGVVGVYDAQSGYARVAELSAHGVGPHELRLLPDGRTLVIANGGILTDPDTGRDLLNLDTMSPSLAYVDCRAGRLLHEHRLPDAWHQLGIRHIDVAPDGTVGIALQHADEAADPAPIAAVHRGDGAVRLLHAPEDVAPGLRNYGGSACLDGSGGVLAVSAPRGNGIAFWHAATGAFAGFVPVADGCGLAPAPVAGRFLASSGMGGVVDVAPAAGQPRRIGHGRADVLRWDNHFLRVAEL